MDLEVRLAEGPDGLVAPDEGGTPITLRLSDVTPASPRRFQWSGLRAVAEHVVRALNQRDLIGVRVGPPPDAIEPDVDPATGQVVGGADVRPPGVGTMPLVITTPTVNRVRVVKSGPYAKDPRVDESPDNRIIHNSPLAPAVRSVVRQDLLNDYVFRLNRVPDRHVDVALSGGDGGDANRVTLDYLVTQVKPWQLYFQASNTGTRQTQEWRERIGYVNYQTTGNDDVLNVDYSTAGFDASHQLVLKYEAPVGRSDRVRFRAYGSYSEYTASDAGRAGADFQGDEWTAGADVVWNVAQKRDLFVDLVAGARFQHVSVDQEQAGVRGSDDFLLPHVGLEASRVRATSSTAGLVDVQFNLPSIAKTDQRDIERLGRADVDRSFVILNASLSHSICLEPLLHPGEWARADFQDPARSSRWATLAHEIGLSVRGQHAFGARLVPQLQDVAGGFYTVRGYDESLTAGDSAVVATAEYRFHIPRSFGAQPDPAATPLFGQPFRFAPQVPYGRPDWDVIVRAFVDAGRTFNSDRLDAGRTGGPVLERNETLVGAGVGVELDARDNISLRCDWGVALHHAGDNDYGDNRFHIVGTFSY